MKSVCLVYCAVILGGLQGVDAEIESIKARGLMSGLISNFAGLMSKKCLIRRNDICVRLFDLQ